MTRVNLFYIRFVVPLALAVAPLFLSQSAAAQTYDAYVTTDSVTVGDRFELVVSVEHDESGVVIFPHVFIPDSLKQSFGFTLGDFVFLNEARQGRRNISRGWVIDSLVYNVTTFALDTAFVSLLPVGLISDTDTLVAGTPPVVLAVTSLVPEDAEGIRDITDLAEFPSTSWMWPLIIGLILAAAGYWYWRRFVRKTRETDPDARPEPVDPPWDEAQKRLQRLEDVDLSDPELIKPFYVELSEILRTYIERRTRIPALESSTSELLARLREAVRERMIPEEMIEDIREVLSQADLVKFAKAQPPSTVGSDAILHTRDAIDRTEKEIVAEETRKAAEAETAAKKASSRTSETTGEPPDNSISSVEPEPTESSGDGSSAPQPVSVSPYAPEGWSQSPEAR